MGNGVILAVFLLSNRANINLKRNTMPTTAQPLPYFQFHPDPLATGAVRASQAVCVCCGMARGYIYFGPVYAIEELNEKLCPWCIADGSSASKLGASFADSYPLVQAGVSNDVVEEINLRTPGYESWQQESWLSHCGDACEFHGDATSVDVSAASDETKQQWKTEYKQDEGGWQWATDGYRPGGSSAFYKFQCRHCRLILLGWDLD
jgi:uncharacterized protein CbrC (UPF0167 family)